MAFSYNFRASGIRSTFPREALNPLSSIGKLGSCIFLTVTLNFQADRQSDP
jgi:hypothetical protein